MCVGASERCRSVRLRRRGSGRCLRRSPAGRYGGPSLVGGSLGWRETLGRRRRASIVDERIHFPGGLTLPHYWILGFSPRTMKLSLPAYLLAASAAASERDVFHARNTANNGKLSTSASIERPVPGRYFTRGGTADHASTSDRRERGRRIALRPEAML